jgi:hypothetical protein
MDTNNNGVAQDPAAVAAARMAKMEKMKGMAVSSGKAIGFMAIGAALTVGIGKLRGGRKDTVTVMEAAPAEMA